MPHDAPRATALGDRLSDWLAQDVIDPIQAELRAPWNHLRHLASAVEGVRATEIDRLNNAAAAEDRVRSDYAGRSVIELLQNAHDACADAGEVGTAWIVVTPSALVVANQGLPFDAGRVHALIQLGDSSKTVSDARHHTIGYKGVGFTAVLELTDQPQVFSAPTRFGFDRRAASSVIREALGAAPRGVPLRYFPFPLVGADAGPDEELVTRLLTDGAVTAIRLPFRDPRAAADAMTEVLEGLRPQTLLFMPSLKRLVVETPGVRREWSRWNGRRVGRHRITHLRASHAKTESWLVAARTVPVPPAVVDRLDDKLWADVSQVEAKVALPWRDGHPDPEAPAQPIHVYFPTDDSLGRALLVHGDFYVHSSRRRITTTGPGLAITELVQEAVAELVAEVAVDLRHHGEHLVGVLTPVQGPEGYGVTLASAIDARLATAPFLPGASRGAYLAPADAKAVRTAMSGRHRARLVSFLEPDADLLSAAIPDSSVEWLSGLGLRSLEPGDVVRRLQPSRAAGDDALLSVLATWFSTLTWIEQQTAAQALPSRPVLKDDQGRWRTPEELMSIGSRTPAMPPSLARHVYAPPNSAVAREFAAVRLPVKTLTPEVALDQVLALVAASPHDVEIPGVLEFLADLWRSNPGVLRAVQQSRLARVPVPARTVGARQGRGYRPAGEVYFTREWVRSRTLETLYGPFGELDFLAVRPASSVPSSTERGFWSALGVADVPRMLPIQDRVAASPWWATAEVQEAQLCPDGHPYVARIADGMALDRLELLLERGEERTLNALAAHLLAQKDPLGDGVRIRCTHSSHSGVARRRGAPVPGFQWWLLHENAWVPSEGGPTGARFGRPRDLWVGVPRSARAVLATPRADLAMKNPGAIGIESAQRGSLDRLEAALGAVRAAHPELTFAPADVRAGLEWLVRRIDQLAARSKQLEPRSAFWPARRGDVPEWSDSPLIADIPGVERAPGVVCLPRAPWPGLRKLYALRLASAVVASHARVTGVTRGNLLGFEQRVELLALLVETGRASDAAAMAYRLARMRERLARSIAVTYSLEGHTWEVRPPFHLTEQRDRRGALRGCDLVSRTNLTVEERLDLAQELGHYLGQPDAADTVGLYLTVGTQLLATHRIIEQQLEEARELLRRHRARRDLDLAPGEPAPADTSSQDEDSVPEGETTPSVPPLPTPTPEGSGEGGGTPLPALPSPGGQSRPSPSASPPPYVGPSADLRFGPIVEVPPAPRRDVRQTDGPRSGRTGEATPPAPGHSESAGANERRKVTGRDGEAVAARYLAEVHHAAVRDVSDQYVGWDLTAVLPSGETWHVEVKASRTSGPDFTITPNEVKVARADPAYRICVVTGTGQGSGDVYLIDDVPELLADENLEPSEWRVREWQRVRSERAPWSNA
ncbi:MAG: DUF3883 domain-containing protein [Cellulomonas sp.]|uniref:sacsin N-terminal ATP-binding-like domain-containing protein n=1 Tax=Cellulomonas sp. TaxID=40001 RepID=UPI00258F01D1|nr:DUF3883 domain-containing protein [Cellulomonas sp.]MCR6704485.1 DUF3883 domain-containing protein [Cellulomonas sp.]